VTLREYLTLMEALDRDLAEKKVEDFYFLSRACLVKDERNLDKFDRVFGHVFRGLETLAQAVDQAAIPDEWLKKLAEKYLTDEEKKQVEAMGWDKLMETLRERLKEQKGRHQGGSKWIGTAGTSPFGPMATTPKASASARTATATFARSKCGTSASSRISTTRPNSAVRNMRHRAAAAAPLRPPGRGDELDLDGTIRETANKGYLDVKLRPGAAQRRQGAAVLDVGGSMDWHVEQAEELFSAARAEFKHFEHFYFHNCLYERVWKENRRRFDETTPTLDVIRTYPSDYRAVFVGDASMSPYEILMPGGSVEHLNEEAGQAWLERLLGHFPKAVWLNPIPQIQWGYTHSIGLVGKIFGQPHVPAHPRGHRPGHAGARA
jgi:uncharacterized protein with von Willebrand factor type A (vWA) domain